MEVINLKSPGSRYLMLFWTEMFILNPLLILAIMKFLWKTMSGPFHQLLIPVKCKWMQSRTVVSQVITGYLPSLILHLFLSVVPPIMKLFSSMQGYIAYSEIEKSACGKMLLFTIWNIFFANVLTGSITSQVQIFLDPKNIPWVLAVVVPAQVKLFSSF